MTSHDYSVSSTYTGESSSQYSTSVATSVVKEDPKETTCTGCKFLSLFFLLCYVLFTSGGLAVSVWTFVHVRSLSTAGVADVDYDAVVETLTADLASLMPMVDALSDVQEDAEAIEAVQLAQSQISAISEIYSLGRRPDRPASSCSQILQNVSAAPSGYYWVRAGNGSAVRVYCDMTMICGDITDGWMKVGDVDFTSSCPNSQFARYTDDNISGCHISSYAFEACASVFIDTLGVPYSRVCGKVIGYQHNDVDAFSGTTISATIDRAYVDGVILSYGTNPRKHLWTFACALDEDRGTGRSLVCECSNRYSTGTAPPDFVGENYFCDSGFRRWDNTRVSSDALWDGAGCGLESICCVFNTPPWFFRRLPARVTEDIELRLCKNGGSSRYVVISTAEIYIHW